MNNLAFCVVHFIIFGGVWCPAPELARLTACKGCQFGCLVHPPSQAVRVQQRPCGQAPEKRDEWPFLPSLARAVRENVWGLARREGKRIG
jgi:hypothetical protein